MPNANTPALREHSNITSFILAFRIPYPNDIRGLIRRRTIIVGVISRHKYIANALVKAGHFYKDNKKYKKLW